MGTNRQGYILQGFIADENFNKQQAIIAKRGQKFVATLDELRAFILNGNVVQHAILTDTDILIDSSYKKYNFLNQAIGNWKVDEYYGCNEKNNYGFWLCTCKCGNRALVAEISLQNGESTQCNKCRTSQITLKQRQATPYWEPIEFDHQDYALHGASYWKYRCTSCGAIKVLSASKVDNPESSPRCDCMRYRSKLEDEVYEFIRQHYNKEIVRNAKTVVTKNELDIYMPDLSLAIECDGNYWHSDQIRPINYHINKTLSCAKHNIRLIHIFEYEWDTKKEKIQQYLLQQLGLVNKKIHARQCEVVYIQEDTAKEFYDKYHLQGGIHADTHLGLMYNNEIVELMSFGKPRFTTAANVELLRLSIKAGYSVTGGASKLFTYFIKHNPGLSVVSYTDLSKFTGAVYAQIGMTYQHRTDPNYVYVDHKRVLTRYQCMKHKLVEQGFDPSLSESEIMRQRGFNKIYDCGNAVYLYEPSN